MITKPVSKIAVAVSSCLVGHKVRYDGNDKKSDIVQNTLCDYFDCRPICPEIAIGLGVPREPIQIVKIDNELRVLGVNEKTIDVTDALVRYADFICDVLPEICGFIFKSRSPSCGLFDVPIFNKYNLQIGSGAGIFASRICHGKATLPVIDEIGLAEPERLQNFIREVEYYSLSVKRL